MVKSVSGIRPATKRRRGTLTKKLFRDMARSLMQFLAMLLLCALGTWVFSGLDATWRMLELSIESHFESGNLADAWVKSASFTQQQLLKLGHLEGVEALQARVALELDAPDLGESVSLMVDAYDGEMTINTPLIREGESLNVADLRGCLLEEQFAQAHGLSVGDSVTVEVMGARQTFVIRGIILSAEYMLTSKDVTPDPEHYGFMYISSRAVPQLPFTEAVLRLQEGVSVDDILPQVQDIAPGALVLTQSTHQSTASARNYISMFKNMTLLFPVLVFIVAAMIVVSTLTRMMEGQRVQMGTLKALGYRDGQIRAHYLSYALVPSLIGSVIGLFVGQVTIPYVIWRIVATNLRFPWQRHAPISTAAWSITALSVVLSVFICLHTYMKAARETTASLLRPKPPKSGTRILLERIGPLWRRFSFNTKMIVRNLMRSKGRTALTLVGVLCCNMLIICTFGLSESIEWFIRQYYEGTLQYDLRVDLNQGEAGTLESYRSRLSAETVDGVMELSVSMSSDTHSRSGLLTVLADDQSTIYLGDNATLLEMPGEGAVISRKLAGVMGVALGDSLTVWLTGDTEPVELMLTGYAETNIGQGLFLSETAWNKVRKGAFRPTALLVRGPDEFALRRIEQMDEMSQLKYPEQQCLDTMRIMDSTAVAFSILSGAALGLAFIICYNMGLMSFTERTRDYATLKVLGYHQKEIRGLMMRENDLTAILGVLLGIAPGIWLTGTILKMCEYETMVFVARVSPVSILLACAITFVFTCMIEYLLTRKVRTIDMVEALKSVE